MVDAGGLSVAGMRVFLAGAGGVAFELPERAARWGLMARVLAAVEYAALGKGDKGVVRRYLERVTGLKRAQVTRLIGRWRRERELRPPEVRRECFPRRYGRAKFERLAGISVGHICNLRKTKLYRSRRVVVERTAPQRSAHGASPLYGTGSVTTWSRISPAWTACSEPSRTRHARALLDELFSQDRAARARPGAIHGSLGLKIR